MHILVEVLVLVKMSVLVEGFAQLMEFDSHVNPHMLCIHHHHHRLLLGERSEEEGHYAWVVEDTSTVDVVLKLVLDLDPVGDCHRRDCRPTGSIRCFDVDVVVDVLAVEGNGSVVARVAFVHQSVNHSLSWLILEDDRTLIVADVEGDMTPAVDLGSSRSMDCLLRNVVQLVLEPVVESRMDGLDHRHNMAMNLDDLRPHLVGVGCLFRNEDRKIHRISVSHTWCVITLRICLVGISHSRTSRASVSIRALS